MKSNPVTSLTATSLTANHEKTHLISLPINVGSPCSVESQNDGPVRLANICWAAAKTLYVPTVCPIPVAAAREERVLHAFMSSPLQRRSDLQRLTIRLCRQSSALAGTRNRDGYALNLRANTLFHSRSISFVVAQGFSAPMSSRVFLKQAPQTEAWNAVKSLTQLLFAWIHQPRT